ncbi:acyl-CoA thioesterase [Olivibacter sitiensis]|uniref:acyl-CoA thioesterase n=1 Tax=Olivibacter sitiensis TaxID=376470 RepID=UPI00040F1F21|nr:thioesterase family protein [Olivibacter sitiensis]
MFVFETSIRVRYGETDQMGYMYYGNYAEYYEVARTEMMRSLGTSYSAMEQNKVMLPVIELHCKYIKPAHYDELLRVRVILKEMPKVRMRFEYEVYNPKDELINTGETTLVFVDMMKNKPCLCPADFASMLKPYFEDNT